MPVVEDVSTLRVSTKQCHAKINFTIRSASGGVEGGQQPARQINRLLQQRLAHVGDVGAVAEHDGQHHASGEEA